MKHALVPALLLALAAGLWGLAGPGDPGIEDDASTSTDAPTLEGSLAAPAGCPRSCATATARPSSSIGASRSTKSSGSV